MLKSVRKLLGSFGSNKSEVHDPRNTQAEDKINSLEQIQITRRLILLSNPTRHVFPIRSDFQQVIQTMLATELDEGIVVFAYGISHSQPVFLNLEWVFTMLEQETNHSDFVVVEIGPAGNYLNTNLFKKDIPIPEKCKGRCGFILWGEDGYLVFGFDGSFLGKTITFDPSSEFPNG